MNKNNGIPIVDRQPPAERSVSVSKTEIRERASTVDLSLKRHADSGARHNSDTGSIDLHEPPTANGPNTLVVLDGASVGDDQGFSTVVELVIDEKKAIVHEHLLCEISGFFKQSARQDASQRQSSFSVRDYSPDMQWSTLMVFINWIYFNKLYEDETASEDEPPPTPGWNDLLNLYFLANQWEIVVLKNLLLDIMIRTFMEAMEDDAFPRYYTKKIVEHTASHDPLRRLWVDSYRGGMYGARYEEINSGDLDLDFLKQLSIALINEESGFDRGDLLPYLNDPAEYHFSGDVASCCCRTRFEGNDYQHKSDYVEAKAHKDSAGFRLLIADQRVGSLEAQVMALKDQVRALENKATTAGTLGLEVTSKAKALHDTEQDLAKERAKSKALAEQLLQLQTTKTRHEQDQVKKIEELEASVRKGQITISNAQSTRDKEANTFNARIRVLENQLRTKTKELEDQKHLEIESAKKRKLGR